MSKIYPPESSLTVRQRIERSYKAKRKHDPIVTVHDCNSSEGEIVWFYLSDYEEFKDYECLDERLHIETGSTKYMNLGIQ